MPKRGERDEVCHSFFKKQKDSFQIPEGSSEESCRIDPAATEEFHFKHHHIS